MDKPTNSFINCCTLVGAMTCLTFGPAYIRISEFASLERDQTTYIKTVS
jgi:hypothetical protein